MKRDLILLCFLLATLFVYENMFTKNDRSAVSVMDEYVSHEEAESFYSADLNSFSDCLSYSIPTFVPNVAREVFSRINLKKLSGFLLLYNFNIHHYINGMIEGHEIATHKSFVLHYSDFLRFSVLKR